MVEKKAKSFTQEKNRRDMDVLSAVSAMHIFPLPLATNPRLRVTCSWTYYS